MHSPVLTRPRLQSLLAAALVLGCGGGGGDRNGTAPDVPVASLTVTGTPAGPVLAGSTVVLTATPRDASGNALAGRTVVWTTSNALVATVDNDGTVSSATPGTVTVTATSGAASKSIALDFRAGGVLGPDGGTVVALGSAVALSVLPNALSRSTIVMFRAATPGTTPLNLVAGSIFEITPESQGFGGGMAKVGIHFPNAVGFDVGSLQLGYLENGAWKLIDAATADPSTRMVWAPVTKLGTFAIFATVVDHVTLVGAPAAGKLFVGQSAQLAIQPYDVSNNLLTGRATTWSTSDPGVVTISASGRASAVSVGSAVITGTVEGKSASTTITTALVPVSSVSVVPSTFALFPRQTVTLVATTRDSAGGVLTGRAISWSTSDASKATVDATGAVRGVAGGSVTVTATSEGRTGTAQIVVLPAPATDWSRAEEWRTFQGNASHDGHVAAVADPADFHDMWTVSTGSSLNPVTAGDGRVYTSSHAYFGTQMLRTLNAQTGATLWTKDFGGIHGVHPPAYGNGTVYVTTSGHSDSYLWGFDAATGDIRTRTPYGNQWSTYYAPVVMPDAVFMAGGYYDGMYAFNTSDGSERWFFSTSQYDKWTPAVRDGVVYAYTGSYSPKMYAVRASDGGLLYDIADPNFSWDGWSMNVALSLGSQQDALATHNGRLISFDLAGHAIRWERPGSFSGQVTILNNVLYVVSAGQVEARNESDGALLWIWVPPEGQATGPIVVTDNLLFVSTSARTYALDLASRKQVWTYDAGGSLAVSSQGILFIARADGRLSAIAMR